MKACAEIFHFYFRYMGGLKTGFEYFVLRKCCSLLRCLGMSRLCGAFWYHVSCSFRRGLSGQLWLRGLWTLFLKCVVSLAIRTHLLPLEAITIGCMFQESLGQPWTSYVQFSLDGLWSGALFSPDDTCSLKLTCNLWVELGTLQVLSVIADSMIAYVFIRHLLLFYSPPSFSLFTSLTPPQRAPHFPISPIR